MQSLLSRKRIMYWGGAFATTAVIGSLFVSLQSYVISILNYHDPLEILLISITYFVIASAIFWLPLLFRRSVYVTSVIGGIYAVIPLVLCKFTANITIASYCIGAKIIYIPLLIILIHLLRRFVIKKETFISGFLMALSVGIVSLFGNILVIFINGQFLHLYSSNTAHNFSNFLVSLLFFLFAIWLFVHERRNRRSLPRTILWPLPFILLSLVIGTVSMVGFIAEYGGPDESVFSSSQTEKILSANEISDMAYSADMRQIAYTKDVKKRDEKGLPVSSEAVMLNGRKVGQYDFTDFISLSENGQTLAFLGKKGDKNFLVVNGEESEVPYDNIVREVHELAVSPDGSRVALVARSKQSPYENVVLINGEAATKPYGQIRDFVFSPDSSAFAFTGTVDPRSRKMTKNFVVVGNIQGEVRKGKIYNEVTAPAFLPNGDDVMYTARQGERWVLVRGEKEGEILDGRLEIGAVCSDNTIAYIASKPAPPESGRIHNGQYIALEGKKDSEVYQGIHNVALSPDCRTVAYTAWTKREQVVFVGNRKIKSYKEVDDLGPVFFSVDGKKVMYGVILSEYESFPLHNELWRVVEQVRL